MDLFVYATLLQEKSLSSFVTLICFCYFFSNYPLFSFCFTLVKHCKFSAVRVENKAMGMGLRDVATQCRDFVPKIKIHARQEEKEEDRDRSQHPQSASADDSLE